MGKGDRQGCKTSRHNPSYHPDKEKKSVPKFHIPRSLRKLTTTSITGETPANIACQSVLQTPQVNELPTILHSQINTPPAIHQTPASHSTSPKMMGIKPSPITIPRTYSGPLIDPERSNSDPIIPDEKKVHIIVAPQEDEKTVSLKRLMMCITCCELSPFIAKLLFCTAIALHVVTMIINEMAKLVIDVCSAYDLSSTALKTQAQHCYNSDKVWCSAFSASAFILGAAAFYCFRHANREPVEYGI